MQIKKKPYSDFFFSNFSINALPILSIKIKLKNTISAVVFPITINTKNINPAKYNKPFSNPSPLYFL
jgi:hypothetical protein